MSRLSLTTFGAVVSAIALAPHIGAPALAPLAIPALGWALPRISARVRGAFRSRAVEHITVRDAIDAAARHPGVTVTIRGRVRVLIPAAGMGARCAISMSIWPCAAGRFLVEDPTGHALIDDAKIAVVEHPGGPERVHATVRDGDEVVVRGAARLLASSDEYRAVERTLVIEGNAAAPIEIARC